MKLTKAQRKKAVQYWLSLDKYERPGHCPFYMIDNVYRQPCERYDDCRDVFPELMTPGWYKDSTNERYIYHCDECPCAKFTNGFVVIRAEQYVNGELD